jgi:hypothetical protein
MNPKRIILGLFCWYILMILIVFNPPAPTIKTQKTTVQLKLEKYIGDEYIASVIARTKYPYLLAAIACVESDFRPQAIGDRGKAYGMFQVWPSIWGWNGDSVESQAMHAERILSRLLAGRRTIHGVQHWNGGGPQARQYARRVIAIAKYIESIKV